MAPESSADGTNLWLFSYGYADRRLFCRHPVREFCEDIHAVDCLGLAGILGRQNDLGVHDKEKSANWDISNLLLLAVATSIDVLATGLLFVPYPEWLYPSVITIGGITALFSLGGYMVGMLFGKLKINMELVGGLVLIALGVKICIEGLCF